MDCNSLQRWCERCRLLNAKQLTTTPNHAMSNGVVENFNKTIKNLLKKVIKTKKLAQIFGSFNFAVRNTPQDSTNFTPFGYQVRTPMPLLKQLWMGDNEDPEVKTSYQYMVNLRHRFEKTCALARNELAKVQTCNQKYYKRPEGGNWMMETVCCYCYQQERTNSLQDGEGHTSSGCSWRRGLQNPNQSWQGENMYHFSCMWL